MIVFWSILSRFGFPKGFHNPGQIRFFGSVSAPGINLEAVSLQKAAGAHFGRFFLWFLIVWRLFWDISSLIFGKLSYVFFMDVDVPWTALYYAFSGFLCMLQLVWSRGCRCIDHVSRMRFSCVLPLCSQGHHLHIRSLCRFSVPACRYRFRHYRR